jgi:Xaa-Pro aminopeptidase
VIGNRVERLREKLEEPLLVSDPANVRYLSGLASSNAALLVEPERVRLFTDFRYAEGGRAVGGAEFVETKRDLFLSLAEELSGRVGFEATSVTYERHARLHAAGIELVPTYGVVEELRAVKDDDELEALRRAAAITSEALAAFAEERFIGRTERELAWRMEQLQRDLGGDATAFPVVVASGPNGAKPHTTPGDRAVEAAETVIVDAGCIVDGYASDCTRTFATGTLPDELRRAYEVCLDAQLTGLSAVQPGASGPGVDAAARDRIEAAGFGEAFGHGLGHGVGLLVHEAPRLAQESRDTLQPGNVVTVEPGIYLAGLGGIRIEDLVVVVVGDGGPEVLTSFTKDLISVD